MFAKVLCHSATQSFPLLKDVGYYLMILLFSTLIWR
jgi:hypothetical protein